MCRGLGDFPGMAGPSRGTGSVFSSWEWPEDKH